MAKKRNTDKQNKKEKRKTQLEINCENLSAGESIVRHHSLFQRCYLPTMVHDGKNMGKQAFALVSSKGVLQLNEHCYLFPKQWAYVIAHNLLHLAFGHFDKENMPAHDNYNPLLWNMACDIYVDKFLEDIKFGQSIHESTDTIIPVGLNNEIQIYEYLKEKEYNGENNNFGTGVPSLPDMIGLHTPLTYDEGKGDCNRYVKIFSYALARSVSEAVSIAAGYDSIYEGSNRAAKWFIDHYPLLGGLASHFKIIENSNYCIDNDIQVAAIDVVRGEIYINPSSHLSFEEMKFVLAHEYLHAGLMHHERCNGRDSYLWNVACDFVINGWLHELQIGSMPENGCLYDPSLQGMSAESIYDLIITDMRKYSKLSTLRGYHKGDVISTYPTNMKDGITLDDFCRSALQQGLEYHIHSGRGFIPAGLIEEIRALSMPPIPWDVALAKWFHVYFAPLEKRRTYARPSRRQASTPDIPRPSYTSYDIPVDSRTFGVIIDTSGSMNAKTIGMALGSIASYAVAHEVPFARVIFCDAVAYDAGYLSPEDIAGRVAVKGRGGTILQPGIHLLEQAKDFPKDGPILIITDGEIEEHLDIRHEHAYLMPKGSRLPFRPKGDVFYFEENI